MLVVPCSTTFGVDVGCARGDKDRAFPRTCFVDNPISGEVARPPTPNGWETVLLLFEGEGRGAICTRSSSFFFVSVLVEVYCYY